MFYLERNICLLNLLNRFSIFVLDTQLESTGRPAEALSQATSDGFVCPQRYSEHSSDARESCLYHLENRQQGVAAAVAGAVGEAIPGRTERAACPDSSPPCPA